MSTTPASTRRRRTRSALVALLAILITLVPATAATVATASTAQAAEDCAPVAMGRYAGEFTASGRTACLELPLPQGARMAALTSRGGASVEVGVEVVDAAGTSQCEESELGNGGCELTGTAPFRARVRADESTETGAYGVHFVRTDQLQAADCPALPAGSFADDTGAVRLDTGTRAPRRPGRAAHPHPEPP